MRLNSFRELRVYQELRRLHLAVHAAYEACDKMLARLYERLSEWRGTARSGYEVRENAIPYDASDPVDEWAALVEIAANVMDDFASTLHPPPPTFHPPPSTLRP